MPAASNLDAPFRAGWIILRTHGTDTLYSLWYIRCLLLLLLILLFSLPLFCKISRNLIDKLIVLLSPWRLGTSQCFHESSFNPVKSSHQEWEACEDRKSLDWGLGVTKCIDPNHGIRHGNFDDGAKMNTLIRSLSSLLIYWNEMIERRSSKHLKGGLTTTPTLLTKYQDDWETNGWISLDQSIPDACIVLYCMLMSCARRFSCRWLSNEELKLIVFAGFLGPGWIYFVQSRKMEYVIGSEFAPSNLITMPYLLVGISSEYFKQM